MACYWPNRQPDIFGIPAPAYEDYNNANNVYVPSDVAEYELCAFMAGSGPWLHELASPAIGEIMAAFGARRRRLQGQLEGVAQQLVDLDRIIARLGGGGGGIHGVKAGPPRAHGVQVGRWQRLDPQVLLPEQLAVNLNMEYGKLCRGFMDEPAFHVDIGDLFRVHPPNDHRAIEPGLLAQAGGPGVAEAALQDYYKAPDSAIPRYKAAAQAIENKAQDEYEKALQRFEAQFSPVPLPASEPARGQTNNQHRAGEEGVDEEDPEWFDLSNDTDDRYYNLTDDELLNMVVDQAVEAEIDRILGLA